MHNSSPARLPWMWHTRTVHASDFRSFTVSIWMTVTLIFISRLLLWDQQNAQIQRLMCSCIVRMRSTKAGNRNSRCHVSLWYWHARWCGICGQYSFGSAYAFAVSDLILELQWQLIDKIGIHCQISGQCSSLIAGWPRATLSAYDIRTIFARREMQFGNIQTRQCSSTSAFSSVEFNDRYWDNCLTCCIIVTLLLMRFQLNKVLMA